jgi:uncharacterized repeat protein (TIGR01451 family)
MPRFAPKSAPSSRFPSKVLRPASRALVAVALAAGLSAHASGAAINVNKTFTPDAVKAGLPSKVTFYFLNANIADATSLAFIDALPAGMFVAPTPNAVTGCGGTLTATAGATSVSFSGGTIPKAVDTTPGHCELSFDVVVPNPNVLINTVPAGEVTSSQGPNVQDAEATLNVTGLAPISGSKSFSPGFVHGYLPSTLDPIPVGGKSTVTITLNNPNDVALTSVAFTDNLPSTTSTPPVAAGGLLVSPVPNPSNTCGGTFAPVAGAKSVSLSGGTIPAFGSCTIKFDVVAESPTVNAQGNITNTIPAGAVTSFEGPTNASFSAQINRQTGGNLAKSFSPATIANNGTSLMTLTVRNYNVNALNNIAFTDPLPAGMTIADPAQPAFTAGDCQSASSTFASGFSVTLAPGGSSIVVSGGTLASAPNSGNPAQCTIRVNVVGTNAGTGNAQLKNVIAAGTWDGTIPYPETSATLTVLPTSLINGTKTFSPATVFQGQTSLATIALKNDSGVALTSFGFTDNVQAKMGGSPGLITIAASPAPTNDCGMTGTVTPDSKSISFAGGTLAAGATCTVTFTVQTLANTSTGSKTNTIDVNGVSGTPPSGPAIKNLIAISGALTVAAPASASKSFNPGTVPMGTDSLLTITVTRPNNAPAWSGFTITDPLPAGHTVSPVAATPAGNACVGTLTANPGDTSISFTSTSSTVPANNASCTIRVNVRTPATCSNVSNLCTETNTVPPGNFVVTFTGGGSYSNTGNITAQITRSSTYVTLTKSFDPPVVDLMGTSTMFLRIVNTAGNAIDLHGVNLADSLPAGLVLAAVPNPQFTGTGCTLGTLTATPGDNKVTLTNATVPKQRICTIQVLTQALAAGNLINQVPARALTSTELITNLEPVAATVTSTGLASLSVTKTDGVTELKAGGATTYTIVVTNADLANVATVAGATFTDTPPTGMTFTSWSCVGSTGAVCTPNGTGPIVDSVTIPKGGAITYTVQALLAADYAQSSVKNCATIEAPASVIDVDLSDNEACDTNNVPRGLTLKKAWVNGIVDDAITVATTGLVNNASVTSTSTGNNTTTGTQVFNLAGGTVTLPAETFTTGSQSNYTTTVACTGATPSSTTPGPDTTFTMPNADVVCTYTNTRVQRGLTLRKVWVNAKEGDAVSATTTGLANNASVSSTADATGNNSTNGTPVSNVAGGTVTLPAESFTTGSQSSYTTTVACTGATASSSSPPATFTMPENDVTCTYTNTRITYTVTLKKTWIDGKSGDAITVATQGLEQNASVTSTSTGSNTDTGTPAANPPGATVTLPAETFTTGSSSDYTTTVACTGAELSGNAPGATFTMPSGNVVCTYTNTRKSVNLQLVKTWITALSGNTVTLSASGFANGAAAGFVSTASSPNETDPGAVVKVFPGESGVLSESAIGGPTGGTWQSGLSCTGNANPLAGNALTVSANDTSIVCTFTNQRFPPGPPPPPPVVSVPVGTPEGLAMLAAMLALMGAWSTRRRVRKE